MKTYSAKPSDVTRNWYIVDASEATLGRVATQVARMLTGKDKPMYTPHIDCGDYVVVTNAKNVKVTASKMDSKMYYRHSGHPGNLKEATMREKQDKDPTFAIYNAVRGMLPVNKLRDGRLARLKIYADAEHNHEAQKPKQVSVREGKK